MTPATNKGAMIRPKIAMPAVTRNIARRRPRSASSAEMGIVAAKKMMQNNCICRNVPRLNLSALVPQERAKTVIR